MLSMDEAHKADYADRRRIDDLRRQINEFLENPPSRAHKFSLLALEGASEHLWEDCLRIDRVWD